MKTVDDVMAALKTKGSEQTRKTYARHGVDMPMFGVKIADLKKVLPKETVWVSADARKKQQTDRAAAFALRLAN